MKQSRRCAPVNGHAEREGEETGSCDMCQLQVNTKRHNSSPRACHTQQGTHLAVCTT